MHIYGSLLYCYLLCGRLTGCTTRLACSFVRLFRTVQAPNSKTQGTRKTKVGVNPMAGFIDLPVYSSKRGSRFKVTGGQEHGA